uniref:Uncharacterized protein n=1 Tax=Arundo donax TaxID=35708 RepID=A0A0A9HNM8_ARUDO
MNYPLRQGCRMEAWSCVMWIKWYTSRECIIYCNSRALGHGHA